ncbi:MAG TPA: Xaa-Pro peptidase family protein [Vicinamibacterales bacterium]|jgi:Xaa-Pro dipeptidase
MFTRREFLAGSSALLVGSQLPAPIASLPSMKAQAAPITADERRARIEQARRLMAAHRIDAIMLTEGTSLVYFTAVRWDGGERLFACVVPQKGEPFFVCPAFEEERAREQIALGPFGGGRADIRTWNEDQSPYALVADGLRDRRVAAGTLGIEETTKHVWSESVAKAATALTLVTATPVVSGCRMIKSPHEIELMRLASRATLSVYAAVYKALAPGMTQDTVSGLISEAYRRVGFPGEASVQVGEYTALPHGSIQPQTIREGTIIMIDDGCTVEGYQSDLTRTFVLGKATDKQKRVFDIVKTAQTAALKAARPGATLDSIDAAARTVITDAGYGPGFKFFTHRVGHGIGMDGHEWPYLVKNNMFGWEQTITAQPHMTFSDEPGVYIRGEFGVRLEDDMHITENGAELFTPQSASLENPFGG